MPENAHPDSSRNKYRAATIPTFASRLLWAAVDHSIATARRAAHASALSQYRHIDTALSETALHQPSFSNSTNLVVGPITVKNQFTKKYFYADLTCHMSR